MLFELYKLQRQDYLKREEKLHTFAALLHATVGTNFSGYLKNLTTPHSILRQLKKVARPSQATLQQMVLDDLKETETVACNSLTYGVNHKHNTLSQVIEKVLGW